MNCKPLYQRLASAFVARRNCAAVGNTEWFDRHTRTIQELVSRYMPSGSGWDTGTQYDLDSWTDSKMTFTGSFHHMDDHGGYAGWTDHVVTVRPSFDGIELRISGSNRNDIKDHLHDMFYTALRSAVEDEEIALKPTIDRLEK